MAYHDGQPFNENHLRPCPMLENPELLREMIAKVGGFPFYKHPKTLHRPKGSFTNPQGIYLVEKRTLQNAKSFFLLLRDGKDIFAVFAYEFEPSHALSFYTAL